MKKYYIGVLVGTLGATWNTVFLLMASGINNNVYISIFLMWICIGILISACDFKLNGAINK